MNSKRLKMLVMPAKSPPTFHLFSMFDSFSLNFFFIFSFQLYYDDNEKSSDDVDVNQQTVAVQQC